MFRVVRTRLSIALVVVIAALIGAIVAQAQDKAPAKSAGYEYKCVTSKLQDPAMTKLLNDEAGQGWRLHSITGKPAGMKLKAVLCLERTR